MKHKCDFFVEPIFSGVPLVLTQKAVNRILFGPFNCFELPLSLRSGDGLIKDFVNDIGNFGENNWNFCGQSIGGFVCRKAIVIDKIKMVIPHPNECDHFFVENFIFLYYEDSLVATVILEDVFKERIYYTFKVFETLEDTLNNLKKLTKKKGAKDVN